MSDSTTADAWSYQDFPEHNYYEESYFQQHEEKYRFLEKIVTGLSGVKKILDIGVGTGVFYSVFPDKEKYDLYGIDIVSDFLPVLESRNIHSEIADINKDTMSYLNGTFDLVICSSLLEHSLNPKHVITELMRVLKPGGFLVLETPNAMSVRARWNYLRGRNPFWPLIDNLYSRDYLRRCSIFYSTKEIRHILPKDIAITQTAFLDEKYLDPRTLSVVAYRLISRLVPSLRDTIVVVAQKPNVV